MSAAWIVVLAVSLLSMSFKASGPVLIGGRALPPLAVRLVELLAPVMLAALVTVQAVGGDREIVLDARLAGLGAAGIVLWRGGGLGATMVVAAAAAPSRACSSSASPRRPPGRCPCPDRRRS